jgi:hypothetical protein
MDSPLLAVIDRLRQPSGSSDHRSSIDAVHSFACRSILRFHFHQNRITICQAQCQLIFRQHGVLADRGTPNIIRSIGDKNDRHPCDELSVRPLLSRMRLDGSRRCQRGKSCFRWQWLYRIHMLWIVNCRRSFKNSCVPCRLKEQISERGCLAPPCVRVRIGRSRAEECRAVNLQRFRCAPA